MKRKRGRLIILSSPSGGGKTTLRRMILSRFKDIVYSVSYTTRAPREGEVEGVDYHFISEKEFEDGIKKKRWAEWALVHGRYYGTDAFFIDDNLNAGKDVLLDIDVQGAERLLSLYPDSVSIFILPPSRDVLEQRLLKRGTEDDAQLRIRLENAEKEMQKAGIYSHRVVNDDLQEAFAEICRILETMGAGSKEASP